MATNRDLETVVGATYPNAMRHLQRLIMDADECAKNIGQKSLFGGDKFESSLQQFMSTVSICTFALVEDGHLDNPEDTRAAL